MDINAKIASELSIKVSQVDATIKLIDEGNTIPFIARYRKEVTGSLDDTILRDLFDRLTYLRNLEKRKEEVANSITEQGKMTEELQKAIDNAITLAEVEDIYRPYKQKRKTRASVARDKGLEPLSNFILLQNRNDDPEEKAAEFIDEEKGVNSVEEALQGAMDIIAETVSDDAGLRKSLRELFYREGIVASKAGDSETESVYENYYDYKEPVNKIAEHRILAIDRGEREDILKVSVDVPEGKGVNLILAKYYQNDSACGLLVKAACEDGYKRLIYPSVEREIRSDLTAKACENAIKVFASNLRQLLMQPPVKNSVTLGLDPAYRTGCKIAVVNDIGKVVETTVIYPTPPQSKVAEGKRVLTNLIKKHGVTTIAIGNGTASHESEVFVAELLKEIPEKVSYMVVSEAGASVYSASKLAAEEFPQFDVSLRSAVSIARRLQDPLAELVKIDPKAVGVGQYQHDMPKTKMDEALLGVVEDCVNSVGVDLNSASHSLLSYVAGVNATVAKNIVSYREENGSFKDRKELLKVAKLGKKAFEQCAGFLRVADGKNPLDNTGVHPESYKAAKQLIEMSSFKISDISGGKTTEFDSFTKQKGLDNIAEEIGVGVPTLTDIVSELKKPGRDPRDELPPPLLRSDVMDMKDLKAGMELMGTVRNVIDFGAFVDIGVHEDGLVHISQICNKFIKHPLEIVKVGDIVKVWVLSVDMKKKRIALTMREDKKPD